MYSDDIILRTETFAPLATKGSDLTPNEVDLNFIYLYRDLQAKAIAGNVPAFDGVRVYTIGEAVTYNDLTYGFVNAVPSSGVIPGTDPDFWVSVDPSSLIHEKDKDLYLDRFGTNEVSANEIRNFIDDSVELLDLKVDKFSSKYSRIEIPSTIVHPLAPFEIVRSVGATARLINFDSATLRKKLSAPIIKYLDQVNGLDTNTGDSWAQAYKSYAKLRTVTFDRALTIPGNFADVNNPMFPSECEIISVGGTSNVCAGVIGTERTWVSIGSGTWTNVLTAAITVVVDTSKTDAYGNPFRLQKMTSIATVQATPDSWWKDTTTNTIYVHYLDGLTPSRTSAMLAISAVVNTNGHINYRENIRFICGTRMNNNTATPTTIVHKSCKYVFNTTDNGLAVLGNGKLYLEDCVASHNFLDGFNYHGATIYSPAPIEVGCVGFLNGENNTTSINNGSTSHESAVILRIGGVYFNNEGPNVHDVNSANSLNIDCVAYDSLAVNPANRSNFALGASASETCTMYLDGCTTHGEITTFGAEDRAGSSNIKIRNCYIGNVEPGTTLISY